MRVAVVFRIWSLPYSIAAALVPPCEVRNGQRGQAQISSDILCFFWCVCVFVSSKGCKTMQHLLDFRFTIELSLMLIQQKRCALWIEQGQTTSQKWLKHLDPGCFFLCTGPQHVCDERATVGPQHLQRRGVASWQVYAITRALRCATSSKPICGLSTPYWAWGEMGSVKLRSDWTLEFCLITGSEIIYIIYWTTYELFLWILWDILSMVYTFPYISRIRFSF